MIFIDIKYYYNTFKEENKMLKKLKELLFGKPAPVISVPAAYKVEAPVEVKSEVVAKPATPAAPAAKVAKTPKAKPAATEGKAKGGKGAVKAAPAAKKPAAPKAPKAKKSK